MTLAKVISGAQTGVDIAGLKAAKAAGLATGGCMPRGFKTLDGPHPEYAELYGVREIDSQSYAERTLRNVEDSDGTVRFASDWRSPGELCTQRCLRESGRPHYDIDLDNGDAIIGLAQWISRNQIEVLNVAGNSEQTCPGIESFVFGFLTETFKLLEKYERDA